MFETDWVIKKGDDSGLLLAFTRSKDYDRQVADFVDDEQRKPAL